MVNHSPWGWNRIWFSHTFGSQFVCGSFDGFRSSKETCLGTGFQFIPLCCCPTTFNHYATAINHCKPQLTIVESFYDIILLNNFKYNLKMSQNYIWNFLKTSKTRTWKSGSEALTSLNLFSRSIWLFFRLYLDILDFLSLGIFFVSPLTAWNSNFFKLSGFAGPSGRPNPSTPIIICIFCWNTFYYDLRWFFSISDWLRQIFGLL